MINLSEVQAKIETALEGLPGSILVENDPVRAGIRVSRALNVDGEKWTQESYIAYDVALKAPMEAIVYAVGQDLERLAWRKSPATPAGFTEEAWGKILLELIHVLGLHKRGHAFPLSDIVEAVKELKTPNFFGYRVDRCDP